jgi:hypothetical protein
MSGGCSAPIQLDSASSEEASSDDTRTAAGVGAGAVAGATVDRYPLTVGRVGALALVLRGRGAAGVYFTRAAG